MFERRLKILLLIVFAAGGTILLRAAHLQILNGEHWRTKASESMRRFQLVDTTRGSIYDHRGRLLASDEPCTDVAVDYRAIEMNAAWLREEARARLIKRSAEKWKAGSRADREKMLEAEVLAVRDDIEEMWALLAQLSGWPAASARDQVEEIKATIRQRVQMRRRYVQYRRFTRAVAEYESNPPAPWYHRWMVSGEDGPEIDSFEVTVVEQTEPHVILRAVNDQVQTTLFKIIDRLPGLELRRSKHRLYAHGAAAAHILGRLSTVTREDLDNDPFNSDDRRQYYPNDLVGRTGIEALCEATLRGSRGKIERIAGRDGVVSRTDPVGGQDVRLTIDIQLQAEIQEFFARRREYRDHTGAVSEIRSDSHGAAVVIDIPTGQVRAMASCPSFDINRFDTLYSTLSRDEINKPLLNRATQLPLEPGSTVKAIVALAALTDGTISPSTTIECTGYLVLQGIEFNWGRCWIARQYESLLGRDGVRHHKQPEQEPHPTGFLVVTDAVQRSCNVFFETAADMMGMSRLNYWFDQFGLGRRTGIGIAEATGRIPDPLRTPRATLKSSTCFAGIGQGAMAVTPLQLANVVATVARNGVWVRPHLLAGDDPMSSPVVHRGAATRPAGRLDRYDLDLSPEGLKAVRDGMVKVVNTTAGTGVLLHRPDITIAGKTGSAQTPRLAIPLRDERGELIRENGRVRYRIIEPNTYPWYQGVGEQRTDLAHAWVMGYVPAENPQLAFAVLVEYGGSGGRVAGDIAREVLEACIQHGYLHAP